MSNIIIKQYLSEKIVFTDKGWINATQTAKNFNKLPYEYMRSKSTQDYIKIILKQLNCKLEDLVITYKGQPKEYEEGTFLNKIFEEHFIRWLIKSKNKPLMQSVYILKGGSYTKIGITNDMEYRLKQLQTGNPFKLKVFFITELINNAPNLESFILNKYKNKSMQGEWLELSDKQIQDCIQYINSNKK